MSGYIIRRLLQSVIVLIGVTIVAFVLLHLLASGPALAHAIIGRGATPEQIQAFIESHGLDKPLVMQYLIYMWHLLHGNFGHSYKLSMSVAALLSQALPKDALLVLPAMALSLLLAVPIGLLQAFHRNGAFDNIGTFVSLLLWGMPYYLIGLLLISIFSIHLNLLPSLAPQGSSVYEILQHPTGLILPILTQSLGTYALYNRFMRSSAVDALAQDFVRTVKANGVGNQRLLWKHILRNSVLGVVTLVGLSMPVILTAAFVVEYVFNYPGIGYQFFQAAISLDYPVELGIIIVMGILTVLGNLAADLAYAALDPRIRYTE